MMPALTARPCPACQTCDTRPEVAAAQPAEAMTIAQLSPFWTGLVAGKPFFTYHRCEQCGLLFNTAFFDGEQLGRLYSAMAPNMDAVPEGMIEATQAGYLASALARTPGGGDYLEIGPDVGYIVAGAAATWQFDRFWLFEPNVAVHDHLAAATGGRSAKIVTGLDDLSIVPDCSVGLAVMIHVLDHLLDPAQTLARIYAKLRPGGTLLVVTHNEASLLRQVLGPRWPPFCLQHPQLFSPGTLRQMLAQAGFQDVDVSRSVNHFPLDFLAGQALQAVGLRGLLARQVAARMPRRSIALRLGNILALGTRPPEDHRVGVPQAGAVTATADAALA